MVNISIDVTDLGGEARPGDKVVLWKPAAAGSSTHAGRVISTAPVDVFLTNGKATVPDVEPGSMRVLLQCRGVESQGPIDVTVPDGNGTVTLRSLMESQFTYSPPVVSAVQAAADKAASSERNAIKAQVRSEAAADRAEAKVEDAINNGANLVRNEVKQDADRAVSAKQAAAQSESNAKASETAASKSASNAKTSETKAKTSETNAKTSETNAASSAASAKSQQESALTHLNNAVAEAGKAAGSAAAAKESETKAAASASASASSASSASTQAGKSATSATQAGAARDAAKASETAAANSAAAAKTSETNAAQSSSSANTHRAAAAEQATAASQSATSAASARDAAKQSQSAAKTSETNANTHRQAAATSQSKAATHETNAGKSATAAAGSATEAKGHADRAEQMADPTGLRNEVMQQLADLVDGAPEDLDTIREIAEYAQANRGITDQLNAAIGNKADKSHTHTQSQVTGLSTALNGKADKAHTHDLATLPGRISNEQAPDVTIIGDRVDLNTYETTGVFAQNMNAYAAAGTNYPVDRAGLLEVVQSRGMTYQTYTVYSSGAMYYRGLYSQSWGPWKEVSTKGHTHTSADITDATSNATSGSSVTGKLVEWDAGGRIQTVDPVGAANPATKRYVDSRPALFSGSGAPPASIPGATVGDWWLDTDTMELHKITGV